MAIASATQAQQIEFQRQLGILSKDVDQLLSQFQDVVYRGPEIDAKIPALEAAIAAIKAAAPAA